MINKNLKLKKWASRILTAGLMTGLLLVGTGCEERAQSIEEFASTQEAAQDTDQESDKADQDSGEDSDDSSSNSGEAENSKADFTGNNKSKKLKDKWIDTVEPEDGPFSKVEINADVYEYTGVNKVVTADAQEYNKDFVKEMCERVYGGTPEVYDYNAKTKKLYDSEIDMYKDLKAIYEDTDTKKMSFIDVGEENVSLETSLENTKNAVDEKISELEKEREEAPESIENDYSYGGYVGNILGDEYYMYFGNCNYDEYVQAPITEYDDGRVCSIFRTDMKSMFDGKRGYISHFGQAGTYEDLSNPPEEIRSMGDEFVKTIGYGDYEFSDAGGFYYKEGFDKYLFFNNDYLTATYLTDSGQTGYIMVYTVGGTSYGAPDAWLFSFDTYVDDKEAINSETVIYVFANDKGVIGCQLVNPLTVKSVEDAEVISIDDAKDIVISNVGNEAAWNIASDSKVQAPEIDTMQLISFPIRSTDNENEYTFVPAYVAYDSVVNNGIVDSTTISEQMQYAPFMLINALDGSFINVNDHLSNYPKGFSRGNEGYQNLVNGAWKRFENITGDEQYY